MQPHHPPLFPLAPDATRYRKLSNCVVQVRKEGNRSVLRVPPATLTRLAETAFHDAAFYFRASHLAQLAAMLTDRAASDNDCFVARALLRNAVIAAEGVLPSCQDTGTATIFAHKGENVVTGTDDARALSRGVAASYTRLNLRASHLAPLGMLDEQNTGNNLPAQIEIEAVPGRAYEFLFVAKGGGSANKTSLFQESKALLGSEKQLLAFLEEKIRAIGVAACPPYHLVIVIGGTSPELTLKTVKLAAAGYLDTLVTRPTGAPHAYRDLAWEKKIRDATRRLGLGAQFGGTCFALDVRVIRLPRHSASLPIGIGVSCNAHRNLRAKITRRGVFLEKLETNPARFLPKADAGAADEGGVAIDLDQPMSRIVAQLAKYPVGTRLSLSGTLVVARDLAHIRMKKLLDQGKKLPAYFRDHPIYYAGPAKTPRGFPSGSFGPTTAQRMDDYVAEFMRHGASRVMLAKGNRRPVVAAACRKYNGFYLGTIGGAAALVARENITSSEVLAFPELGMETVRCIRVKNLPAFLLGDNRGRTLY